jgi:hypothetical protein
VQVMTTELEPEDISIDDSEAVRPSTWREGHLPPFP